MKKKRKLKDLSGDGKITKKDVLIGRGVIGRSSAAKKVGKKESLMSKYSKRIKSGKSTGTSTLRELKIAMKKHGQDLTGFKSGGMAKGSREGSVIKASKGTHVTKDGRTVKKGLYYNMNKRRKAGTSRPGKGTVSAKALKQSAKTAFKPKKKS